MLSLQQGTFATAVQYCTFQNQNVLSHKAPIYANSSKEKKKEGAPKKAPTHAARMSLRTHLIFYVSSLTKGLLIPREYPLSFFFLWLLILFKIIDSLFLSFFFSSQQLIDQVHVDMKQVIFPFHDVIIFVFFFWLAQRVSTIECEVTK